MPEVSYTIRAARSDDASLISTMLANEGMDDITSFDGVSVAANTADEAVGLIRIQDIGEIRYVNPIVIYPTWRNLGVGEALMHSIMPSGDGASVCPPQIRFIRLVSRGGVRGFYEHLGFIPVPWDAVDGCISSDCEGCEMFDECSPCPMSLSIAGEEKHRG